MPDINIASANAGLDTIYDAFVAGSVLEIRTGAPPGADEAASGTLLASITLPATPWAAASGGSKAKSAGAWSGTAVASGTAGHYRLRTTGGERVDEGTVTLTGGGGDMELDNTNIASGQTVTVSTFSRSL